MTPAEEQAVMAYRENLRSVWGVFRSARLTRVEEPVFANVEAILRPDLFPDRGLLEVAAACAIEGKSILLEDQPDEWLMLIGTAALNTYGKEERFLRWPFIPIALDMEVYNVGLTRDRNRTVRMACAVKDILYDRWPSIWKHRYYLSKHPFEKLPLIMAEIVKERREFILIGQV